MPKLVAKSKTCPALARAAERLLYKCARNTTIGNPDLPGVISMVACAQNAVFARHNAERDLCHKARMQLTIAGRHAREAIDYIVEGGRIPRKAWLRSNWASPERCQMGPVSVMETSVAEARAFLRDRLARRKIKDVAVVLRTPRVRGPWELNGPLQHLTSA